MDKLSSKLAIGEYSIRVLWVRVAIAYRSDISRREVGIAREEKSSCQGKESRSELCLTKNTSQGWAARIGVEAWMSRIEEWKKTS